MTLIVGMACTDGAIIAADSASTDPESGTKQPSIKINRLKDQNILYGGSGDVGLLQQIKEALENYNPKNTLKRIRQEIIRCIRPIYQESINSHVPYPIGFFQKPPIAILLFVGITNGKPWILEVERDCRTTHYGENLGNFCAIGSGKPWAQAIFRPFLVRKDRTLELGKIFICRILCDAIDLSAGGLSHPIHIYELKPECEPRELDEDEIERLKDTCETWRQLQVETVGRLLTPQPEDMTPPEIPHESG